MMFPPVDASETSNCSSSTIEADSLSGPHHVVLDLPLKQSTKLTVPVLFVAHGTSMHLHVGATRWARAALTAYSHGEVRRHLRILGQLHDFWIEAWEELPLAADEFRAFVWSYLYVRYRGTNDEGWDSSIRSLAWRPLAYSTVRAEFSALVRVLKFSRKAVPDLEAARSDLSGRLEADSKLKQRDFFVHLEAQRENWRQKFGHESRMPRIGVRALPSGSQGRSLDRTVDDGEIDQLIRAERHPMRRGIWVLCRYGGVRISEALNMWQADVLTAGSARHIFDAPMDSITPILAHPHESRYLGDFTSIRKTRQQHLADHYGLVPRPDQVGRQRVGWKGCQLRNEHLKVASVFWLPGGAELFEDCMEEILAVHSAFRTTQYHPWLFVNMQPGESYGQPLCAANLRRSLSRGFENLGLQPGRNGRRIHGLRHRYKADLEAAGLSPQHIQICMRHRSILSQEDYGLLAMEAQNELTRGFRQRGSE